MDKGIDAAAKNKVRWSDTLGALHPSIKQCCSTRIACRRCAVGFVVLLGCRATGAHGKPVQSVVCLCARGFASPNEPLKFFTR